MQLQFKVPCGVSDVVNSSLFINSSLSPGVVFHHSYCLEGGPATGGGGGGGGLGGRGHFYPPCHILHYHMVLRPEGTLHNDSFDARCFVRLGHQKYFTV